MLLAEKNYLQRQVQKQALDISEKELRFFSESTMNVATQGALLLGFAYSALVSVDVDKYDIPFFDVFFIVSTLFAMLLNMNVVATATGLTVLGENLALRGAQGSTPRAVEGMRRRRSHIFMAFSIGLVMFHFSTVAIVWGQLNYVMAGVATFLIMASLLGEAVYFQGMMQEFAVEHDSVVSGELTLQATAGSTTGTFTYDTASTGVDPKKQAEGPKGISFVDDYERSKPGSTSSAASGSGAGGSGIGGSGGGNGGVGAGAGAGGSGSVKSGFFGLFGGSGGEKNPSETDMLITK